MDFSQLKLELINFSEFSPFRWRLRRIIIGWMLFTYYAYAFIFFLIVAVPNYKESIFGLTNQPEVSMPPLLIMLTFGFIGGVFFITRTFVRTSQTLAGEEVERRDVAAVWYLTRPFQSALMAIFIYYAFRAGQLVFYSMEGAPSEDEINVYTLSLIAIMTGAFTEQAFEKLHSIATSFFKVKKGE